MPRAVFVDGPADGRTEFLPDDAPSPMRVHMPSMRVHMPSWRAYNETYGQWSKESYELRCVTWEGTRVYAWIR